MINIKQALKIVSDSNPEMKAISCIELEKYYSFKMIPKELGEDDCFANSSVYLIDKETGKYRTTHFIEILHEPVLRRIEL